MNDCEVWIVCDEDGNYSVAKEFDELETSDLSGPQRMVKMNVRIEVKVQEVTVELPDEPLAKVEVKV